MICSKILAKKLNIYNQLLSYLLIGKYYSILYDTKLVYKVLTFNLLT